MTTDQKVLAPEKPNTYSGGTDRPGVLCYNFSISNKLTQLVNFPSWIPDCDSQSRALLNLLISSDASICSTMAFLQWERARSLVVSDLHSETKGSRFESGCQLCAEMSSLQ